MLNTNFDKLVVKAKKLNQYDESFAQGVLWAERGTNTSMEDIKLAVERARNNVKERDIKTLMYNLVRHEGFFELERSIKRNASMMVDSLEEIQNRYELSTRQANDLLALMTTEVKKNLFNKETLRQIW